MQDLSRFSFGATSAVTSSMALLVGLNQLEVSKVGIIGALLVIAFADNIADSLGMHIYSESKTKGHPKLDTLVNYLTRVIITLIPILLVIALPLQYAIIASVIYGLAVLSILSYLIAVSHKLDPVRAVAEHLIVGVLVVALSQLIGTVIHTYFGA